MRPPAATPNHFRLPKTPTVIRAAGRWYVPPRLGGERHNRRQAPTPGRQSQHRHRDGGACADVGRSRLRRRRAPRRHRAIGRLPGPGGQGEVPQAPAARRDQQRRAQDQERRRPDDPRPRGDDLHDADIRGDERAETRQLVQGSPRRAQPRRSDPAGVDPGGRVPEADHAGRNPKKIAQAPPAGAAAAQTDTFQFGAVRSGESKDIVWRVTPVQPGPTRCTTRWPPAYRARRRR